MIKTNLQEKEVKKFIVIFYCIGLLGFIIPYSNNFFKVLTPYALLTNFFILAYFHPKQKIKSDILVFSLIFICGLVIEIFGVATKNIFGDYTYGTGLGLKIYDTPLIIGLNWLFLSYTISSVVDKIKIHTVIKIILASLLMLIYDIVLEQIAPKMNMWSWKNDLVPLQNYIAWFVFALIFNSWLKIFKVNTQNPLSIMILGCQFLFFLILLFYFRLFQ